MANYFFNPGEFPEIPKRNDPANDDFLFSQGPTKGLGKIQFHDSALAYNSLDLPNVNIFKAQIEVLKEFLLTATPSKEQAQDIDFLLNLGELFTLVAYGQLLIEKAKIEVMEDDIMDQIFDFMVRDFSKFALQLYLKTGSTNQQMNLCLKMIKKPEGDQNRFNRVWEKHIAVLDGAYEMNP
jgi:acyl-CoA dehydrogenase